MQKIKKLDLQKHEKDIKTKLILDYRDVRVIIFTATHIWVNLEKRLNDTDTRQMGYLKRYNLTSPFYGKEENKTYICSTIFYHNKDNKSYIADIFDDKNNFYVNYGTETEHKCHIITTDKPDYVFYDLIPFINSFCNLKSS